jgi:type I restriction enzyme S subunit
VSILSIKHGVPIWTIARSREEFNRPDLPVLTVISESGIQVRDFSSGGRAVSEDLRGYRVVRPGDLVVNRLWARFGAYGISPVDVIISPAYWVLQLDHKIMYPQFAHYLLRSGPYLAEIGRISKNLPPNGFDLPWEQFRKLPVECRPLAEQRAIADFLDAETARIDALIAKKRHLITRLGERRAIITTRGITGQLLPCGKIVDSSLPWIAQRPKHWEEPLLKLVARLGSGHTPSRSRPEWWVDCTIPWITTGEVSQMREDRIEYITQTREKISEVGMANSSAELHPAGTVVLSRTASAGFSAIMGMGMATSQDFVTWTCGPLLNRRYLLLCLRAMRHDLLGRLAQGSTHQTIYMPDIESIRIPLPPLEEQEAIVDAVWRSLRKIDEITDLLNRQGELLMEHRQALITAAATGQLEIPGAAA